MAFDLNSLSKGKRMRAPRIILLGVEKIGKSTFAASSNSPALIPVKGEEGTDDLDCYKWDDPVPSSFDDVMNCLRSLYEQEHKYETVVLDSASALEPLIWENVCKRHNEKSIEKVMGGYQKGYSEALKEWTQITECLDLLRSKKNMASIIIGHIDVKRFDDPTTSASYDQYQFSVHKWASGLLYRWADAILFCNTKVVAKKEDVGFDKKIGRGVDVGDNKRFLYTHKTPSHPGGGRGVFGRLPYELPLDWNVYQQTIEQVIKSEGGVR